MGEVSAEEVDRNAMYASKDTTIKLRMRIDSLEHGDRKTLLELWKDKKFPKLESLSDDQCETVHTWMDNIESSDIDSPAIIESEVGQEESF